MTYQEFVDKWRYELAGIALYGQTMNYGEVPMSERTRHAMGVPKLVEQILRRMHADLCPMPVPEPKPAPVARPANNGTGAHAPVKR